MIEQCRQRIARFAGIQAVAEVTIGSLVHGLRIPMGGHALSLNQSFVLAWAARESRSRGEAVQTIASVGNVAAALKGLSPVGKRLTPMLAISFQAMLFALGVAFGGATALGAALGAALASAWGFAQPLLLGYLFFGSTLFEAVSRLWTEAAQALGLPAEWGLRVLMVIVAAKALIGAALAVAAWSARPERLEGYVAWIEGGAASVVRRRPATSPSRGALRDLASPAFVAGLLLSAGFLALSGQASTRAELAWYVLRVVAVAWLAAWAARSIPRSWVQALLSRAPTLAAAVEQVSARLAARSAADPAPEAAPPRR